MDSSLDSLDSRTPTFWTSSITDYDLENMPELERLRYENKKLKHENEKLRHENEVLKLDCESYTSLMDVERGKNLKRCQELEEKISYLSEVIEAQGQSKELIEILNKNIEIVLVSERELKVIYQTQQQMADRALTVHSHLSSVSKKIVDKLDAIGVGNDVNSWTYPVDDEILQENASPSHEMEIYEQDLKIKEFKSANSEKTDSTREVKNPPNAETDVCMDGGHSPCEEHCAKYKAEMQILKDVIKKLTNDKRGISSTSNDEYGQIAVLTSRLVMARLALGELNPTEAYKTLQEANALATYTMEDLEVIAASTQKKKTKTTGVKKLQRLKRIFSTKRTAPVVRDPMPPVCEEEN